MNMEKEDQDLAGNYDVHVPFKPKRSYNAVIKIVEPEYDEQTAQKISDAHELAKMKAGKVST